MKHTLDRKITDPFFGMRVHEGHLEPEPMHPDDFKAHYAWVTAKRFHEQVMEKHFSENLVCYRIGTPRFDYVTG